MTSSEHSPGLLPVSGGAVVLVLVGVLPGAVDEHALVLALSLGVAHYVPDAGWSAPFHLISRPV